MNHEQMIAHLVLHGWRPIKVDNHWKGIWHPQLGLVYERSASMAIGSDVLVARGYGVDGMLPYEQNLVSMFTTWDRIESVIEKLALKAEELHGY